MIVKEALKQAIARLQEAGVEDAQASAEWLLAHVLGCKRLELHLQLERALKFDEREQFGRLVEERAKRKPLAYILGTQEFMGLSFKVDERVMIPRPETELLVEAVLDCFPSPRPPLPTGEGMGVRARIADIGTGCGCIAISLAVFLPHSFICATDISEDALQVARQNAERHAVLERIQFLCGNLLEPLQGAVAPQSLDAIVANLPYVPSADFEKLMPEVRDHEPHIALDGGEDGLRLISQLVNESMSKLRAGGIVALEVGVGQAETVRALLKEAGFAKATVRRDYSGIERVVLGFKV